MRAIARMLGLRRAELPPVLWLAAVYALISGALAAGDATVQSVFLARAGADELPEVLLARALVAPVLAFAYARWARPRPVRPTLAWMTAGAGVVELGVMQLLHEDAATIAYALHELLAGLITVHWGVYLLSFIGGDTARRAVPFVYAAGRGGAAIAGSLLMALLAQPGGRGPLVPVPTLMLVTCGLFLAAAGAVTILRSRPGGGDAPRADADADAETRVPTSRTVSSYPPTALWGLRLARHSRLLVAIAAGVAIMVFVRYSLRYQQQSALDHLGEIALADVLSKYTVIANVAAAVLQVVVAGRLLGRLGIPRMNGLYAVLVGCAQLAVLVRPSLAAALFARAVDQEVKHVVKTPVSNLFYEAFPPDQRGAARAVTLGVVSPLAQVVAALTLAAVTRSGPALIAFAATATLAFAVATWAQNRAYERALARDSLPA